MDKIQAQAELDRLNKIAEGISPEYLRLQAALNYISNRIKYCQGIITGEPIKTAEEVTNELEAELAAKPTEEVKDEPVPIQPEN